MLSHVLNFLRESSSKFQYVVCRYIACLKNYLFIFYQYQKIESYQQLQVLLIITAVSHSSINEISKCFM